MRTVDSCLDWSLISTDAWHNKVLKLVLVKILSYIYGVVTVLFNNHVVKANKVFKIILKIINQNSINYEN